MTCCCCNIHALIKRRIRGMPIKATKRWQPSDLMVSASDMILSLIHLYDAVKSERYALIPCRHIRVVRHFRSLDGTDTDTNTNT